MSYVTGCISLWYLSWINHDFDTKFVSRHSDSALLFSVKQANNLERHESGLKEEKDTEHNTTKTEKL